MTTSPAHDCRECRELLTETAMEGFAPLDLSDPDDIQADAIEDGAEYAVRDDAVAIGKQTDHDGLMITVTGYLFEDSSVLGAPFEREI